MAQGSIGSIPPAERLPGASTPISPAPPLNLIARLYPEARKTLRKCKWTTTPFCPKLANGFLTHWEEKLKCYHSLQGPT